MLCGLRNEDFCEFWGAFAVGNCGRRGNKIKINLILYFYHKNVKSSIFCVDFCSKKIVRQKWASRKIELKNRTNEAKFSKKQNENGKKTIKNIKNKNFEMKFARSDLQKVHWIVLVHKAKKPSRGKASEGVCGLWTKQKMPASLVCGSRTGCMNDVILLSVRRRILQLRFCGCRRRHGEVYRRCRNIRGPEFQDLPVLSDLQLPDLRLSLRLLRGGLRS